MQTGKFVVGSINKLTGKLSFTEFPAEHPSESVARKEAERLCKIHQERKFVVVEVKGIVQTTTTVWE